MPATHALISLLGEIALLLWGIHMVGSGVMRAFGADLRRGLGRALGNRFAAFVAGLGVTAVLQSSTATGLMATSFVAAGVVGLVPALAVMLGANVGTTLIVQVFSFDITLVFPLLILLGVVLFKNGERTRVRDIGRVMIGLGLMLLSLHLLVETIGPAATTPAMHELLQVITREPLINVLVAGVLTWAAHSSVAVVLVVVSLCQNEVVTPVAAMALVLGANLGSAVNPLVAAAGSGPEGQRLPLGNLLIRLVGCVAVLPFLPQIAGWLALIEAAPARVAVNFHTALNLALAVVFIGLLEPVARGLCKLAPDQKRPSDPGTPLYLDRASLDAPSVALANAVREALRMADIVAAMLAGANEALRAGDRKQVADVMRMDEPLDKLFNAITLYLTEINQEAMSTKESQRLAEIFAFAINLEHVGDILEKNLLEQIGKKIKRHVVMSSDSQSELCGLMDKLAEQLRLAISVFMNGDMRAARQLVVGKDAFRDLERDATERHLNRLRDGGVESGESTVLHLDLVRDIKRIESHIAATAYPQLERAGALQKTRLIEADEATG